MSSLCDVFVSTCRFRGARRSSSGSGYQPGRPTKPKETLKFETEYDFELANEEFKGVLSKFEASPLKFLKSDLTCVFFKIRSENRSFIKGKEATLTVSSTRALAVSGAQVR